MIYLSAGHHFNPQGADPGAINVKLGVKEADLTRELRDLIAAELLKLGVTCATDKDVETLQQYLRRIRPGSGSVVCELHFNSSVSLATGVEVLVKNSPGMDERRLASDICNAVVTSCGLFNRGVKTEAQSHRGTLGILHTRAGISVLPEICFISNEADLERYHAGKGMLAIKIASLLKRYDSLYS